MAPEQTQTPFEPVQPHPGRSPYGPRPRRRRPWLRAFVAIMVIAICGLLAYAIYVMMSLSRISTNPYNLATLAEDSTGRTNILLLGVGDQGHAGQGLSDSMMIMSTSRVLERGAQVSIPRDLRVDIPDYGLAKINTAHALGGPALSKTVVSNTFEQPMTYYVKTDFTGLKAIVDVVGGLDIDVKERLRDPEYPCENDQYRSCGMDILPGRQHMDGSTVLQYVRCRKGTCGNDFGRAARQQEVINLLKDKVVVPELLMNPSKLTALANAVRQFVQTDMGMIQMLQFASRWSSYSEKQAPVQLVLSTANGGMLRGAGGSSDLVPLAGDFSVINARIANIFEEEPLSGE